MQIGRSLMMHEEDMLHILFLGVSLLRGISAILQCERLPRSGLYEIVFSKRFRFQYENENVMYKMSGYADFLG